jgi:hypothetical protein
VRRCILILSPAESAICDRELCNHRMMSEVAAGLSQINRMSTVSGR